MKVIKLNESDIKRIVKRVLTEQEENNIITSIDVGGEIQEGVNKDEVEVLGVLGCKNCEDSNGDYTINNVKHIKSKVDDALGDTTEILVFDENKKVVHTEPHPISKGLMVNFKIPKNKLEEGNYFIVVGKDGKTLSYQRVSYEPFW